MPLFKLQNFIDDTGDDRVGEHKFVDILYRIQLVQSRDINIVIKR